MSDQILLKEGEDFYYEDELMILTEAYLRKKGHCCQSGCKHCPYGFTQKADPNIPAELQPEWKDNSEIYDGDIPDDQDLD